MKKILSLTLVALMLATLFVIPTSAANTPFGTVVEANYVDKAPSMDNALPDESWGKPVAHIDKNSPNAGITDYSFDHDKTGVKADQNLNFDAYMVWTDDTLYLCFTSPDTYIKGDIAPMRGDGFQIDMVYGITDISHACAELSPNHSYDEFTDTYSYLISYSVDDYSMDFMGAAGYVDTVLFWDEKAQVKIGKYAIPFTQLGLGKKEVAKDGDYISFSMICVGAEPGDGTGYTGWLEWGDFFSVEKGWDPNDTLVYVPQSMNPKTTTANTIKLVGKDSAPVEDPTPETPAEPETPETPEAVTLKGEPSGWAKDEVLKALDAGLIPEELTDGFQGGISRANLSKILAKLLDKVYGKDATDTSAAFTDTTDADVLKAANLGIINGYKQNDGTYMFKPENTLKRSEMSAIINRVAKLCGKETTGFEGDVKFEDTVGHWCNGELGWPVHNGIVKGTSDTKFSPDNTLTVEQTIMMIYRTYEALK